MSRLGRKPIAIPEKVKVEFKNGVLEVSGAKEKLSQKINEKLNVKLDKGAVTLEMKETTREAICSRALQEGLRQMIEGVTNVIKKNLN
jgi:large subunit ribosomal protein L6